MSEKTEKTYLTTGDLAIICEVEAKTVAAWAEAGKIPADAWFRTPGGQLRFRRLLIVAWFHKQGFDVPAHLDGGA